MYSVKIGNPQRFPIFRKRLAFSDTFEGFRFCHYVKRFKSLRSHGNSLFTLEKGFQVESVGFRMLRNRF
jgi:hypothetical protein